MSGDGSLDEANDPLSGPRKIVSLRNFFLCAPPPSLRMGRAHFAPLHERVAALMRMPVGGFFKNICLCGRHRITVVDRAPKNILYIL